MIAIYGTLCNDCSTVLYVMIAICSTLHIDFLYGTLCMCTFCETLRSCMKFTATCYSVKLYAVIC